MSPKSKIKISSNRNFGLVFFIVFLIVGLWPLTYENPIRIWSVIISLIFLILGLMKSKLRSEEHTSELQSRTNLVCRLLLEKKKLLSNKQQVTLH